VRAKELRERSSEELNNLLAEAKSNLFKDRIKNATHQLTDSSQLKKNRREIARIRTLLNERAQSEAGQE